MHQADQPAPASVAGPVGQPRLQHAPQVGGELGVPDLTHTLRRRPGPASMSAYRREPRSPVDAEVLDVVVRWCTSRIGRGPTHPGGVQQTNT